MAIPRTAIVDDDGSRTTGTTLNNAWKQELYNQIDAAGGVQTIATARTDTGAVNNWAAPLGGNTYIPWNGAADATFSGLAGGVAGQIAIVENITAAKVAYFLHASGLSSAANQFTNTATSGATPIAPGGKLAYVHNGTNWRLIFHNQGAWITPTFAAGNFTGVAPMVWTVTGGQVTSCRWRLNDRTVMFNLAIDGSTLATTASAEARIGNGAWGGFTGVVQSSVPLAVVADGSGSITIATQAQLNAGSTFFRILKATIANWTLGAFTIYFNAAIEVT